MNELPNEDVVPVVSPYPRDNRPAEPRVWSERFPWWLFPYLSSGTTVGYAFVKGNFQWDVPSLLILNIVFFVIACLVAWSNLAAIISPTLRKSNSSVTVANAVASPSVLFFTLPVWLFLIIGD